MLEMAARQLREDILEMAENKFERRLIEESSGLRLDIAKAHISILRWQFVQWLTVMLAILALATRI